MLELIKTLSIYKNSFGSAHSHYVEVHDISHNNDNKPVLGAGRSLSKQEIYDLFYLSSGSKATKRYLLPEDVLMWHVDPKTENYSCVFWLKAQSGIISYEGEDSFVVPWPPVVIKVQKSRFSIFALKENKRPEATTELYDFPVWNRSDNGSICLGNFSFAKSGSPETVINQAKEFWFNTDFSHGSGTKYSEKEVKEMSLKLKGCDEYPTEMLLKSAYCLEDL